MFDEKEIAYLQEMEERITRSMAVLIESDVTPKFSLLADGIKDIQEKLVPRSRMDDLEDEVKFLKLMCRQMAEDIAKLKKQTEYTIQQDGAGVRHRHILSGRAAHKEQKRSGKVPHARSALLRRISLAPSMFDPLGVERTT